MVESLPVPPGFDDLSVEGQIDYLQSLWDRIAVQADHLPLVDWQRRIIDERLAAHEARPEEAVSWDVVRERLRRRFRDND